MVRAMSAPASRTPSDPDPVECRADREPAGTRAAAWALGLAVALVLAAYLVPKLTGWEVYTHNNVPPDNVPPLHSTWSVKAFGPGTLPALAIAALGVWRAGHWAATLRWSTLLLLAYAGGLAWLLSLALVDGPSGLSRVLGNPYEYLQTARGISDVPAMLEEFTSRIPYEAADRWVVHVGGHPPGALLFFVLLVHLGLGGDLVAGVVVTVIAATTAVAVLDTLRTLGVEGLARRAAPLLVLGPAAVWTAVSADAVFAATAAWGLAALARSAVAARDRRGSWWAWGVVAGVLLGSCVMFSYGLPLLGLVALAVLAAAGTGSSDRGSSDRGSSGRGSSGRGRAWLPLPVATVAASAVVLAYVPFGYELWSAFPVLRERYWDGTAADRPFAYWGWGNLAALMLCAGPLLAAGLAHTGALLRARGVREVLRPGVGRTTAGADQLRVTVLLAGAASAAIVVADLSRMSKAETERIWLPFVPWLLISTALLPQRWRRVGLAVQVAVALTVQHLLYTSW